MRTTTRLLLATLTLGGVPATLLAGCGQPVVDGGSSINADRTEEGLPGCNAQASSTIPANGDYYLTSFGSSPSDDGIMSCGEYTKHGSWYYAASRQRYGCGAHIKIEANGKCVVAETDDYGPDVCVENAAGLPIIDASPLVANHLFGTQGAGWSDHLRIHVTEVSRSTPLGPCTGGGAGPMNAPPPMGGATCHSSTMDKTLPAHACVQSSSDAQWYECEGGSWQAGTPSCSVRYAWCHSSTLGRDVAPRTCVQSRSDGQWYQCTGDNGWVQGVNNGAGSAGPCAAEYAL